MEFSPMAIVGRSCLFPGASSPEKLWDLVANGRFAISNCPPDRWRVPQQDILADHGQPGRAYTDRGGYVAEFDNEFDPRGFAIDPQEISRHDELLRWTLHTARQALRDAGLGVPDGTPERTGATLLK